MSREFDDIYKKIDQSHKELYKQDEEITKDQSKILKEISDIKKQVKSISLKVDMMLEILNNFTIMLSEEPLEEDYEEQWLPNEDDDWNLREDES